VRLSHSNEEKLHDILEECLKSKGLWEGDPRDPKSLLPGAAELLERNGIYLADMAYNYSPFPERCVPLDMGVEYYAFMPDDMAAKALVLGYLDLS
jgi:hypothetical protein